MIPKKVLEVNLSDTKKFTLGDMALFSPNELSGLEIALGVRRFLVTHTNWTQAEIDGIEVGELEEVSKLLSETIKAVTVPKVKRTRSKIGRVSKLTPSPLGSTS